MTMPNPVAEAVSRLREAADNIERARMSGIVENLAGWEQRAVREAAECIAHLNAERLSRERDTGVPEGCRLTLENVTQLESILAAASHQQWEWTTFTKTDGSPIVSVEDVAKTTAASARRGAGVELHGITPAGLAPDAEGPNVICYTGNGDGSAANARAIVSLWMAAPDLLKIARAMLAPQPPTVSTQGWQDISTAPKDRLIDIWIKTPEGGVRWSECYHDSICDEWRTSRPSGKLVFVKARSVTHWRMPPPPPAPVSGEKEMA